MFATEQTTLLATQYKKMSVFALAGTFVGATFAMTVSAAGTELLVRPQPTTMSSTSVSMGIGPLGAGHSTSAGAYLPLQAEPLRSQQSLVEIASAPMPLGQVMAMLCLPFAAVAAVVAFRKAAQQPAAQLDAIAIAPMTAYRVVPRARTALAATPSGGAGERYEVELEKPIGITLGRGNDGATYVLKVPPGERYTMFTPGDRVTKCSASFGPDIWEALNYGQVMFAIKTRNGNVFLELEKRGGDMSVFESKRNSRFQAERNSGNYGAGTAEEQMKNYQESKERERKREAMWREAVDLVKNKKLDEALVVYENIIGLEPTKFIGDNFALNTDLFRISHYQMACIYSLKGNTDASLESLREAMNAGFDDFKQIRSDPDLARVRETEEFDELMNRFDESPFNADAINALKGVFGGFFGGKK